MIAAPGYGKILTLGSAFTENALVGEVVVQEKVDGSQFTFGVNEVGDVVMRSKSQALTEEVYASMFKEAVEYITAIRKIIKTYPKDTYFYCEYLQKPKHNTLKYEKTPSNHLVLFDVLSQGRYESRTFVSLVAQNLGIDVIPELYRGVMTTEKVKEFLEVKSYLGGEIIEGIVIKNYTQTILLGGQIFPLFTKYVREAFKERHSVEWKIKQPKDSLQDYINGFASEARWQKAFLHLQEKGLIENQLRDLGKLIPTVQQDILEEDTASIQNYLFKCFKDDILRKATSGIPGWYKQKLLNSLIQPV